MSASHDQPIHPALAETIALAQHRAFLEKAQEVAHVGSWVSELSGSSSLSWSPETYRIFGVTAREFDGTLEAFFRFVHPDDLTMVRAARQAAIDRGQQYDVEHRITNPAGQVRWVHERADVIRDTDGRAVRMIGTAQDVTERRRHEEQLRHSQKMEAIGRLAGGVAHDLNNALTAIAGYTDLALAELADDHPAKADVEEIRRATARAESVTRQLLAFSRKQFFEPRLLDLNEILEGLTRLLGRTLGDDISLRAVKAPELPPIMGDPGQVEQAIVNLTMNARDAMPRGGEVIISTSVVDVDEPFASTHAPMPPGRFVLLSVADTGQGLSAEMQTRIFEPFFTTKEVGKGTGLGLAMVYGTVRNCGGFIFVASQVDRGATFRMYFPAAAAREPASRASPTSDPVASSTQTVLIVEDEPAIRHLVATALASEGYQLLTATSGGDALDVVAAYGGVIDLVLTDATMPGMGGVELARELVATRPNLAVIVMSGFTKDIAGIDAHSQSISTLQKPFTAGKVRARVREVLDQSKRRSEASAP